MYREFGITGISTSLFEKHIRIEFTLDVDPDSAKLDALVICEKDTGRIIPLKIKVSKKVVTLLLEEWPVPETEYLLRIQSGGLRSIVDDELPDSLQRAIVFKSEVLSTVDILSPSHHEELNELFVKWEEKSADGKEDSLVSSFYLEIAKENAFYRTVRSTEVFDKEEITLNNIDPGQYYLRIRAQKGQEYGKWSEVVTFIVNDEKPSFKNEEIEEPIFERPLRIASSPVNGETPCSFVFNFDDLLDPHSALKIKVKRKVF